uniref:Uncharacterized protein n=1 Tax=Cacopsylla melanoneura TaxID=428564 RepID=A0A8D8ZAE2_9HEMI
MWVNTKLPRTIHDIIYLCPYCPYHADVFNMHALIICMLSKFYQNRTCRSCNTYRRSGSSEIPWGLKPKFPTNFMKLGGYKEFPRDRPTDSKRKRSRKRSETRL